ncbi:MAG: RsmD family RNA methyltransferase [Candidatus Aenigmarchaeota archaeon]|nr:RsmD family RNA methyltransferase [Candidatus Aenigmarchaeota archaeon]
MKAFMFVTSGLHPTLPVAELESVMGNLTEFEMLASEGNFCVYATKRSGGRFLRELVKRLSLTSSILLFAGSSPEGRIEKLVNTIPRFEMPYRTRVHLQENNEKTEAMEKEIGGMIWRRIEKTGKKPKVDMNNPKTTIEFFFSGGMVYCGIHLKDIKKKQFEDSKPLKRPYFKPVSMDPRIARVMVNLARKTKGRLLDPFCGTGGILIEAGRMGFRVYGIDADREMVEGTKKNLRFFRIKGNIEEGDATELKKRFGRGFINCIVTAPPYGRLSSLKGMGIQDLYQRSMESMEKILGKGGYAVISVPTNINIKTNMQLIEIHREKVNRSLLRNITVYKKR